MVSRKKERKILVIPAPGKFLSKRQKKNIVLFMAPVAFKCAVFLRKDRDKRETEKGMEREQNWKGEVDS